VLRKIIWGNAKTGVEERAFLGKSYYVNFERRSTDV
jgi:hypothetical protein